mmetsp:Transcript_97156/g.290260  ORF Transcript_97156/g.290260 Transcript_97156/m.290260 type:complete len:306 (+) Transcript_97156:1051-1968(+)
MPRGVGLELVRGAVHRWVVEDRVDFAVQMGDLIDRRNVDMSQSSEALETALQQFPSELPRLDLLGNHELYNFNREECARLIPHVKPWYRSFRPAPGWRVIVLDSFDLNVIEHGGGPAVEEGMTYLSQHNPNDLRAPRGTVDLGQNLKGMQRRFLPMGGAVRPAQLRWLENELREASEEDERAIVLTHVPVHPNATVPGGLLWNYDEVLQAFRQAGEGCVALVLAGHYHSGAYTVDADTGTHHVTLPSPLHTEEGEPRAHCTVEVFRDRVEIHGRGLVPSRTLALRRSASASPSLRGTAPMFTSSL